MRKLFLLLPLALTLLAGCQTDADLRPANYDELAMATGHWEWDRSTLGFSGSVIPVTTGYTRQLVFGPDRQLTLRRSQQADYHTDYQFSIYKVDSPAGGTVSHPAVRFTTNESDLANNPLKFYTLSQQQGQQVLTLVGEQASRDAGTIETYHWVAE